MSNVTQVRPSKNERRDVAREKAREARLKQQRRERRNRLFLQGGIGLVVLAIVAIVAIVLVNSVRPAGPGPKNMADDGIRITTGLTAERTGALPAGATPHQRAAAAGKVAIRVYEDFGCPYCEQFETTDGAYVKSLVTSGKATLQIYPVAILDNNFAGTQYSTRAANAAAAVANSSPDRFYAFHGLLYANQPKEGGPGLSDDQLIGYAKQAGVQNLAAITKAIKDHTYFSWVQSATDRFLKAGFPGTNIHSEADIQKALGSTQAGIGTPMVFVDGKYFTGSLTDANAFRTAVLKTDAYTPSATPTPTPTASR
jgi:protein-disulfide isomerase